MDKPDWFLEKNPLGTVPTLETPAGEVVYESPITCEYLDEVYPEKRLLPSNPFGKAQQKMMLEQYSKVSYMKTLIQIIGFDLVKSRTIIKESFELLFLTDNAILLQDPDRQKEW